MDRNVALPNAPFIVGMGRSGTTLLRLMLDKHSQLSIPPETHFIIELLKDDCPVIDAEKFIATLVSARSWRDFDLDAAELRKRVLAVEPFSVSDGLRGFYSYYAQQHEKPLWGDKTPPYVGLMNKIKNILPEAFFIHLIRDGRDSALSHRGLWFEPGDDLALHAKMWSKRLTEGRLHAATLSGKYLEVRFECLVADPENVLHKICASVGIRYEKAMLSYYETARDRISRIKTRYNDDGSVFVEAERIHKIFELTASPPDVTRIGSWRTDMTVEEQKIYETEAGRLLNALGYETFYPELWKPWGAFENCQSHLVSLGKEPSIVADG